MSPGLFVNNVSDKERERELERVENAAFYLQSSRYYDREYDVYDFIRLLSGLISRVR